MRRLLAPLVSLALTPVVCALLAWPAWAGGLPSKATRVKTTARVPPTSGVLLNIPATDCGTTVTATRGGPVSLTRATVGTYQCGGTQTASAGQARVEASGLLVEGTRINYLLNSTAPATQTTASLGTGAYTGWVIGTGSTAFTVGTATATGLPCTATAGAANDCHFTITGAGTITATVTGTLTHFQLEPGAYRTSQIDTAGTAVQRNADKYTAPNPLPSGYTGAWYVSTTATPESGRAWAGSTSTFLAAFGVYAAANSMAVFVSGTSIFFDTFDAAGAEKKIGVTHGFAAGSQHKVTACNDGVGGLSLYLDGVLATPTTTGVGTGILASFGTVGIGGDQNGAYPFDGNLANIKVSRGCVP